MPVHLVLLPRSAGLAASSADMKKFLVSLSAIQDTSDYKYNNVEASMVIQAFNSRVKTSGTYGSQSNFHDYVFHSNIDGEITINGNEKVYNCSEKTTMKNWTSNGLKIISKIGSFDVILNNTMDDYSWISGGDYECICRWCSFNSIEDLP